MKIINELYKNYNPSNEILELGDPSNILFFDIETTGLNKATTNIYLIGCGYYRDNYLNMKFFFGESISEEYELLLSFFNFVKNFTTLIHFNGTKFDLPYIEYKSNKYNIENPLNSLVSLDIYQKIKPLRHILFRESMRQKCVEDFLGIKRNDVYNGGELIPIYLEYTQTKNEDNYSKLMMHNREDVLGMHKIFLILNYLYIKDCSLTYVNNEILEYKDFNDNINKEIILHYETNIIIPVSFTYNFNDIYYKFESDTTAFSIRVPIKTGTLSHYYENISDYYYLPQEEICIHKSIASGIDKSLREKATRDNCCIKVNGDFLPQFDLLFSQSCGTNYKARNDYFVLPAQLDNEFALKYGYHLLQALFIAKPKKRKTQ